MTASSKKSPLRRSMRPGKLKARDFASTAIVCLCALMLSANSPRIYADEVKILSTTSPKEALLDLIPIFKRATGHAVTISFLPGSVLSNSVKADIGVDLLITPGDLSDSLTRDGRLGPGGRTDFARSRSAVAVRKGAPRPDIGSSESFRRALIDARTISYGRGPSGAQFIEILSRLGVADVVQRKTVLPATGELVGAVVARGGAEMGIQQLSELLPVPGIEIVGPLPADLQKDIIYGVNLIASGRTADAANAFTTFLKSSAAGPVLSKHGLDPM